ncbi:STAS domain-containing protein [Jiella mangrovi]|uniref:STAS domain-containing protein n=1 Tax=Jiella mangrovi TaxID=2821407 RepID=A0ABS4BIQ9_9HYPH|nr:STAS domain-containing protein [Jiella mangrovi]MBP0616056.1 STAS domain-containing protein [Jiella mangrovi]
MSSVEFPENFTIRTIQEFTSILQNELNNGVSTLDFRNVKAIDVAGLQIILAARKSVLASGRAVNILADDDGVLLSAAQRAGLAADFREMRASPGS